MEWKKHFTLKTRIFMILAALITVTLGVGIIMIWFTYRIDSLCALIIDRNVATLHSVEAIQTNLVNQKGFVSYYFIDGNSDWLEQMEEYRRAFEDNLKEAKEFDNTEDQKEILNQIEKEYKKYINSKDKVISFYKVGNRDAGIVLHKEVRAHFFEILKLCERYKEVHIRELIKTWNKTHIEAFHLRIIAFTAILAAVILGVILTFVLLFEILKPIKLLAIEANRGGDMSVHSSEVAALGHRVRDLIEDVDHTQIELDRSRARLLQSAKMAAIGKLAAEMAHTIRGPMTSIEMRLYSLEQNIELANSQKEDFEAIYDDLSYLDNIVRNFLEFSRPPKLKEHEVNVSDIIDLSLQLTEQKLKRHGVTVERHVCEFQPNIKADSELLKEVFVNLIVNACEAMGNNGRLIISEDIMTEEDHINAIVVSFQDTGPGIPDSIRDKVSEPFFTTKEEGTGLGLSIASRIIEEHGGQIEIQSTEGEGTTFIITLPFEEG